MKQQTAVEWLIEHLLDNGVGIHKKVRETALELEQIQKMELLNESKGSDATFSQTEISDKEIREQGIKYDNQALSETPIAHFMEGAFWYREQLKKKQ